MNLQVNDARQVFNILSTAAADLGAHERDLGRPVQVAADRLASRARALGEAIEKADAEKRDVLTRAEYEATLSRDPADVEAYSAALAQVRTAELEDEERLRLVNALVAVGGK